MNITGLAISLENSTLVSSLNISSNPFISAGFIFGVFLLIAIIFSFVTNIVVKNVTEKTKTKLDDNLVKKTRKPVFNVIIFLGLLFAILPFNLQNGFSNVYKAVISALIILAVAKLLISVVNLILVGWASRFAVRTKSSIDKDILPLMTKTISAVTYIIAIIMILSQWGVDITALITSAGIAGLAFAFAIQDSLKNVFGGVSLILDRAYKVGDIVELGDGTTGRIKDIGLRSTKIVNWDNNLVTIPNGQLVNMSIINIMGPEHVIKTTIKVGVSYNSDVKDVKKVLTAVLKKNKGVLFEDWHPVVRLNGFGDSSLDFLILYWTSLDDRWSTFEAVNNAILAEFRKNKIEIPFPQQDVYIKQMKKGK